MLLQLGNPDVASFCTQPSHVPRVYTCHYHCEQSFQDGPRSSRCCIFFVAPVLSCCCVVVVAKFQLQPLLIFAIFFCGNSTGPAVLFSLFASSFRSSLQAKAALVAAVPLCHPVPHTPSSPFPCGCFRFTWGGGGVGRGSQPVAFYSKKLSTAEVKYSTFDRELLAAFVTNSPFSFPPRRGKQRHLAYISELTTDLSPRGGNATPLPARLCNAMETRVAQLPVPSPTLLASCEIAGSHLKGLSHEIDFDNIAKN